MKAIWGWRRYLSDLAMTFWMTPKAQVTTEKIGNWCVIKFLIFLNTMYYQESNEKLMV